MSVTPGSETVAAGKGGSFSVILNPPAIVGTANFSVSGAPSGVQASFSPGFDATTGSKTLNIFTITSTPPATAQLTITASDPSGVRTAVVNLTITPPADFTLAVSPQLQTVKPGGSASYTVTVTLGSGATGPVNLSALGMPQGTTASFDRNAFTTSGTATLTLTAGPQILTVIAPMAVVGTDSSGTISASFGFSILPADFFLDQTVGPVEVNDGGTVTGQILLEALFARPGTVSLSASGLPSGMTASFNPGVLTGGGTSIISIATDGTVVPGDYTLTVNGVDASGTNFVTIPFTVVPGNAGAGFFLAASPLMEEITAGQGASFNINVNAPNGTIPPLTFSVSTNQDGLDTNVFPTGNGPGSFGLGISSVPSLPTTGFTITVTATGPNGSQSISVFLLVDVAPPD